jgi:hypothetical protein
MAVTHYSISLHAIDQLEISLSAACEDFVNEISVICEFRGNMPTMAMRGQGYNHVKYS